MGTEPENDLDKRLTALGEQFPELAEAIVIYRAILPLLGEADLRPSRPALTGDQARERLKRGVPLLSGMPPAFDISAARNLMIRSARRLEELGIARATPVREAIESDRADLYALFSSLLAGDDRLPTSLTRNLGSDSFLLLTLARNALKAVLRGWCGQLTALVANEIRWDKGSCFVCGAPAALGELRGNEQAKHLRCGLCGADWRYSRIRCARCGNEDHATLAILYRDPGPDKVRVEVCEKCRGYLKVIVSFAATTPEMLPVEDLATLHLDGIAQRSGYARNPAPETSPTSTAPGD